MNTSHDYRALEREYVTTQISLRELCRKHNISAHSLVTVQARKHKWAEKREQYQAKESDAFMSRYAARQADRLAEIHDKAIDVIDEALDGFREAMRATEKRRIDGEWVEVPVMRLKPKDIAILLDRLEVLFERPTHISEGRDPSVRSELPIDALNQIMELTRGRAVPPTSPLPRRLKRLGFRGDPDRRVQAAAATCCVAQYAASYSAGGISPQAPCSRPVFHQWTQRADAASTSSTERQGPRRLMSSAL